MEPKKDDPSDLEIETDSDGISDFEIGTDLENSLILSQTGRSYNSDFLIAPTTDDISVFVLWYAWSCLSLTNRALKASVLDIVFPTESTMENIAQFSPLGFALGLLSTFRSDTAPTISYFKTLPMYLDNRWAVYLLVLEKDGHRPRIYIGSATNSQGGIKYRMTTYTRRSRTGNHDSTVSYYVHTSLEEGYDITHKGLLAWTPKPLASERYNLRCFFLVMETFFTLSLWAMKSRTKDYYMPSLCPWPRNTFTYDGCCTHFSINERPQGVPPTGSREEINRLDLEKKQQQNRQYILNKGPGVHAANTKKYGDKALADQRYVCTICDLIFRSNAKLLEHQKRPLHIAKATKNPRSRRRKNMNHWCGICKHAASTADRLQIHLKGPRHAKKLRTLALSSKLD